MAKEKSGRKIYNHDLTIIIFRGVKEMLQREKRVSTMNINNYGERKACAEKYTGYNYR